MSNLQAAIGVVQLEKVEVFNLKRRQHAHYLNRELAAIEELDLPHEAPENQHVYQMYTVKAPRLDRDALLASLREAGVGASVHFDPPVHLQDYYRDRDLGAELPVTERVAGSILTLPMFPDLTREQFSTVVAAVENAVARVSRVPQTGGSR